MNSELISKATRNEFREVLSANFVLREIDMIFEAGGLQPVLEFESPVSGQRRGLVEAYYANIDFCSPSDIRHMLVVYEEIITQLSQAQARSPHPEKVSPTVTGLLQRMERDGFRFENGRFVSEALTRSIVQASSLIQLTEESILEHVDKARSKIESGDAAGAIANAYTLIEEFQKQLLRKTATPFNESEGDIRALYRLVADVLNLNPKGDHLENFLKAILEGIQRQIGGLYEVANKASDRHARHYNPAPHHAKLAVNAAFTLCEFLLESHEYQQQRKEKRHVS